MFKLSNGKEFSRLVINCFDTTLGYITKSEKGEYSFKLVSCESMLHRLMLAGLSESSSSKEIDYWMQEHLTVSQNRANRSSFYPEGYRTLEDEIYTVNSFVDCLARSWHYDSQKTGVISNSSYLGAQLKWVGKADAWLKKDYVGGEAITETLVSLFLTSCLNVQELEARYVGYCVFCPQDDTCLSRSFLKEGESFIPLYDAIRALKPKEQEFMDFEGKLQYIDSVYEGVLGYSCKRWLLRVLTLDVMFRNTDRHLSNLGFVADRQGNLRIAPIFDNGLALGVSEGAYYDLANTITGIGFRIKPYGLTVGYLEKYINPSYFAFSVVKLVKYLKMENFPKSELQNKLLLAFFNILVRYYPKDTFGADTKQELEKHFGPFTTKRFIYR
jgi:hipA-like C-terminal domain